MGFCVREKEYKGKPLCKIPPKYREICDELFNKYIDKQQYPEDVVNFHTLRHTVATYDISKFLDHSNAQETERKG